MPYSDDDGEFFLDFFFSLVEVEGGWDDDGRRREGCFWRCVIYEV